MTQKVMVCVTEQKTCERLIKEGLNIVNNEDSEIFVIHVATKDLKVLEDNKAAEALEYLFDKSKGYGASVTVLKSNNIRETLVKFAVDNQIDYVVMGETRQQDEKDSVIFKLKNDFMYTNTKIKVVPLKNINQEA